MRRAGRPKKGGVVVPGYSGPELCREVDDHAGHVVQARARAGRPGVRRQDACKQGPGGLLQTDPVLKKEGPDEVNSLL